LGRSAAAGFKGKDENFKGRLELKKGASDLLPIVLKTKPFGGKKLIVRTKRKPKGNLKKMTFLFIF